MSKENVSKDTQDNDDRKEFFSERVNHCGILVINGSAEPLLLHLKKKVPEMRGTKTTARIFFR